MHTSSIQHNDTAPILSPAHEALLAELFTTGCHIDALLESHNLTPSQFLAFVTDPAVMQTLDAWEALQERHHRILARQAQLVAADHLDASLLKAHPTPEARRVATTLTKLTTHMISPTKRRPSEPAARAGGESRPTSPSTPALRHPQPPTTPTPPARLPTLSLHTPTSTSEFECLKFETSNPRPWAPNAPPDS